MAKIVLTISADNKATQSVKLLNAEVQTLSKTLSSIKVNKNLTSQINALSKYYNNLAKAAVKVNEATTKRQIAEQRLANEVKRGRTEDQRTLKVQAQKETAQLRLKQAQDKATQSTQKATTATKQNTETNKEHRQSILSMTRGILEWQIATTLVMKPLRLLQNALQSINETLVKTEDAVIALQRVLPNGSASDSDISSRLYKIAQEYGQTFENVSQIAQNFARTGMSWADTIKATEAAVLALNVAELDATEASDGMIAIMTQFGIEANKLELVVDKLNITADNAAVTTEKLLAALQRTGSSAANANLSLDETVSLITALSQATGRSGENLGTALNSLIQYSSKASALDVFAGLSDNTASVVADYRKGAKDILDVWQAVASEIKNLDSRQADLLDSYFTTEDGNALTEALDEELQDIYTELGGVYDTANTFRKNYFIALLGNMDTVEQAMGTLQGAAGYSQDENKKYLDTYTAKLNTLKAQWEDIANSEQGLLRLKKIFVDLGSAILWLIDKTGGLRTVFFALGTIVSSLFGAKIITGIIKLGKSIGGLITAFRTATNVAEGFNAALGIIGLVATATSLVFGALSASANKARQDMQEGLSKANEQLETIKQETKETADTFSKYAEEIEKAKNKINDTTLTSDELAKTQNRLLAIQNELIAGNNNYKNSLDLVNGDLSTQLGLLKDMEESEARKRVQDYLDENRGAIEDAKRYKSETQSLIQFDDSHSIYNRNKELTQWLIENGFDKERIGDYVDNEKFWTEQAGDALSNLFGADTLFTSIITDKKLTRDEQIDFLEGLFSKADEQENQEIAGYIRKAINSIKNNQTYQDATAILEGTKNTWNVPVEVLEKFNKGLITYEQFLKEIGLLQEEVSTEAGQWHNNIAKVTGKYDDLIKKLEELRDLNKEAYDWEEKKKAVIEAEQALLAAQNEATVRRFNQETGQWEWQTDEKAIKEAEENLEKAKLDLEEAAYDNIIDQLQEQTATNESILAILKEVAPLLGEDFSNAVQNAIKDNTGVDITQPVIGSEVSHDNGGLALGKGFLNKATSRPESVNNPELTAKILSPVSNEQFNRYVKDMGILFETARQYQQSPVIERIGGATDNRVDNSGQINFAGGITFPKEAQNYSLNQLLAQYKSMSNN